MLFTILGNDFLPKIDNINTNKHIVYILDCYKQINSNIFTDNIRWDILKEFFILLKDKIKNKEYKIYRNKEWSVDDKQFINTNAINYFKQLFELEYLTNRYNPDYIKYTLNKPTNIDKMLIKYFSGYLWLFNYYINHDLKYNYFYYKYHYSPNIDDIIKYINKIDNNMLYKSLNKNCIIDDSKYFNPKLQLLFITPKKIKLKLKINKNKINIFDYLDCKKCMFISKCFLKNIQLKNGKKFLISKIK